MRWVLEFAIAVVLLTSSNAQASEWVYQTRSNKHFAFVESDGGRYGFGFQCIEGEPPLAIFMVDEAGSYDIEEPRVRIFVTPDALSPLVLVAHLLTDRDPGQLVAQSDVPAVSIVLRLLTLTETKVRVAVELRHRDIQQSAEFSSVGIARVLGKMKLACGSG